MSWRPHLKLNAGPFSTILKKSVALRTTLHEMGHPQPPTPIEVDNSTAVRFENKQIKQQKSKSMDMRYYLIQDRVAQKHFQVYWRPGLTNLGDYFTKKFLSFLPQKHKTRLFKKCQSCSIIKIMRGCVD